MEILKEEEQMSLLGKMLYYSAKHLTKREREIYDELIDSLVKKVNKLHTLERQVEVRSPKENRYKNLKDEAKKHALHNISPQEVCRVFIDCWNKQDFETEFFCLSLNFPSQKKKTNDLHEYVLQRMKKYQDRNTVGPISKRIVDISSSESHGDKNSVYCIELHRMPDKDLTMHRQYELIFENGGWRISDFSTLKSHETPRNVASK